MSATRIAASVILSVIASVIYGSLSGWQAAVDVGGIFAWCVVGLAFAPLTVGAAIYLFAGPDQRAELLKMLARDRQHGAIWQLALGRVCLVALILSGETFGASALLLTSLAIKYLDRWAKEHPLLR
jgi:hypothetical protein